MAPFAPINPMEHTIISRREQVGVLSFSDHSGAHILTSTGHNTQLLRGSVEFPVTESWPDPVDYNLTKIGQVAQAKAFSRFDRPTVAYGEPIAELGRTIKLVSDPLQKVADHVSVYAQKAENIRKSAASRLLNYPRRAVPALFKKFKRTVRRWTRRKLAKAWAISSFAILPLWRTVDDSMELVQEGLKHIAASQYNTVYGLQTYRGPLQTSAAPVTVTPLFTTFAKTRQLEVEYKAGITSAIRDINKLSTRVGTRARDIPVTLWEIFPLSFLIDRIVNVKQVIRGTLALSSLDVREVAAWYVIRKRELRSYVYRDITVSGGSNSVFTQQVNPYFVDIESVIRGTWTPTVLTPLAPKIGSGLVNTFTKTLDLLSVIQLKLKS